MTSTGAVDIMKDGCSHHDERCSTLNLLLWLILFIYCLYVNTAWDTLSVLLQFVVQILLRLKCLIFLCYRLQIRRVFVVFGGKHQQAGLWKPPHEKKTFREEAQKKDATGSECPDGRETERYLERRGGRWWRGGSVEQLVAWRDPEYKPSERKPFALHHIPLPLRLKQRAQANQMIFHTKTVFHCPLLDPSSSTCCFTRGTRLQGPGRLFYQLKKTPSTWLMGLVKELHSVPEECQCWQCRVEMWVKLLKTFTPWSPLIFSSSKHEKTPTEKPGAPSCGHSVELHIHRQCSASFSCKRLMYACGK